MKTETNQPILDKLHEHSRRLYIIRYIYYLKKKFTLQVVASKIENGNGEYVKETTTRPKNRQQQKVTNRSSMNIVNK